MATLPIFAKGKRKVKGKTLNLNTFLGEDQDAPTGFTVINARRIDWGDAMENEELDDHYTMDLRKDEKLVLPTAPKAAYVPEIDANEVPSQLPFTAFLGNLPYDVTEDDITYFFRKLEVAIVRLPCDGGDRGKLRGFGYVEFRDRQSLIYALSMNNMTVKNRPIKISLAGEHDKERDHNKVDRSDRTMNDWRCGRRNLFYSKEELQKNGNGQYSGGYSDVQTYQTRLWGNPKTAWDEYEKIEKCNDKYDSLKYESVLYVEQGYGHAREFEKRSTDRRYEFSDKDYPRERRKLQLKPRSKPVDSSSSETIGNSAIFGGAKPVDTAAREREIEERLAREREGSVFLHDYKERNTGTRSRRFSTSFCVNVPSHHSLESVSPSSRKDTLCEDNCLPQFNPPVPRQNNYENQQVKTLPGVWQRRSSASSTGSERENYIASKINHQSFGKRRGNSSHFMNFNDLDGKLTSQGSKFKNTDDPGRRLRLPRNQSVQNINSYEGYLSVTMCEKPRSPVYTSINKFSHLINDDEADKETI